jgi:hypothetical protein
MGSGFQFAELNIHHRGNTERTLAMVRRAIRMGYDTVVVNIDIGSLLSPEVVDQKVYIYFLDKETLFFCDYFIYFS